MHLPPSEFFIVITGHIINKEFYFLFSFLFCFVFTWKRILKCNLIWPEIYNVTVSTFSMLGLQACSHTCTHILDTNCKYPF